MDEQAAVAHAVSAAVSGDLDAHLEQVRQRVLVGAGVAVVGLLAGIGLLATGQATVGALLLLVGVAGAGGAYYTIQQPPDIEVTGVQKRYWTTHLLPQREGTVFYDGADVLSDTELELERLRDPAVFAETRDTFTADESLPVVMPRGTNVEQRYGDALARVNEELDRTDRTTINAPLIDGNSPLGRSMTELVDRASEGAPRTDPDVSIEEAKEDVQLVAELEDLAFEDDAEGELESLTDEAKRRVTEVFNAQDAAVELLNDHIGAAADVFALSTFTFYCPVCAGDDIDSELTPVNAAEASWRCSTCRNSLGGENVIPKHRIRDELVTDIWDQLWLEKDDEKRRIYENIEDQQSELEEREYEQKREEIRDTWGRIKDVRSKIRDLRTKAKAGEGAVDEIGSLMVKYDRIAKQRKEQFRADIEETVQQIDAETEQIMEETRNLEQERIDEAQEAAKQKAELMRAEERRREREKFIMEQQLATQRAQAVAETIDEDMGELQSDISQHHREEMLVESGSKVGPFDTVNKFRGAKTRWVGGYKKGE